MKLPYAYQAFVDIRKLLDYCLKPDHARGRHKARVFEAALGLTRQDALLLQRRLLEAARTQEAVPIQEDEYGVHYQMDMAMTGPAGDAIVRSIWIVRRDEAFPRLTTCYVL